MMLCPLAVSVPVQAQSSAVLRWAEAGEPGTGGNLIATPSEVSEIAAGPGNVFYALDSANARVYRSLDAGGSWEEITTYLAAAGAVLPATEIAVAPDQEGIVAAVTDAGTKVYLSTNGGIIWFDLSAPGVTGTIQRIAVSRQYTDSGNSLREIAIGTAELGDAAATTTGQLWVFQFGDVFLSWRNQNITVDPAHLGGEISAVSYSPSYQSDRTILVIASTASDVALAYQNKTWLCTGTRDTISGTTLWNTNAGYPVEIGTPASPSAGDAPGVSRITSSLALPSGYSGLQSSSRLAFVSYDREPDASDDVYRLADATVFRLNANGGAAIDIASLAYYGSTTAGTLLAGDAGPVPAALSVQVRRTVEPFALSPTWQMASQPPSGPGDARVILSSSTVAYCGTGQSPGLALDESAFSRSLDGGDTWEQISLIDTQVAMLDIAVATSPASLFLATTSPAGTESVWRSAGDPLGSSWGRVLTMNTATGRVILRLSPDYETDFTLYAAEAGGDLIMMSHNRGNSWYERRAPGQVVDLAVRDSDTIYVALSDGSVYRSSNGAWFWEGPAVTSIASINMLSVAADGTILVGGQNGEVAYSTDGGASFLRLPQVGAGDVWVAADAGHEAGSSIYAGNANSLYRWTIGMSCNWEVIGNLGVNQQITGLAFADGILYGAWYDNVAGGSGVERCLDVSALILEWDTMDVGAEAARFDTALNSFQVSSTATGISLWAVDTAGPALMFYDDILAKTRPTVDVPGQVAADSVSGGNSLFALTWPAVSVCTEYDVAIYADAGCTALVLSAPVLAPAVAYSPSDMTSPSWVVAAGQLASGADYYVRLRVRNQSSQDQVRSIWSEPVGFTVLTGLPVSVSYLGPQLMAPSFAAVNTQLTPAFTWSAVSGASEYELILATDTGFTQLVAGTPLRVSGTAWQCPGELDYDTTYFWRVRATEPVPGDWSATASFTTMAEPDSMSAASQPSSNTVTLSEPLISSYLVWLIIGISALLVIGLVVLIIRTGR